MMRKITRYMSDDFINFNDEKECLNYEAVRNQYDRASYIKMVENVANNKFDSDIYEIIVTFDVFSHHYNMYFFDKSNTVYDDRDESIRDFTREEKIEIAKGFDIFNLVETNFKTVKRTLEKMFSIPLKLNGIM